MNQFLPIIELFDRLAIARVKYQRTGINRDELEFYENQVANIDQDAIGSLLAELIKVHNTIWLLEAELKSGHEQNLPLETIGRRAIEIRNWNKKRIELKNAIAEILNDPIREKKAQHLSQ